MTQVHSTVTSPYQTGFTTKKLSSVILNKQNLNMFVFIYFSDKLSCIKEKLTFMLSCGRALERKKADVSSMHGFVYSFS